MCVVKSFTVTISDSPPPACGRRTRLRGRRQSSQLAVSICYELEYAETDLDQVVGEKVRETKRVHQDARTMMHNRTKERKEEKNRNTAENGAEPMSDKVPDLSGVEQQENKASAAQLGLLRHRLEHDGISEEDFRAELQRRLGKGALEDLTPHQARLLMFEMQQRERFQKRIREEDPPTKPM